MVLAIKSRSLFVAVRYLWMASWLNKIILMWMLVFKPSRFLVRNWSMPPEVYYLMNKPAGVVSARRDKEHQTVIDLIKPEDQREGLYPVGRLDRDTEGLVLITNNGPLGFAMLHPRYHVAKTYYVEVNDVLGPDAPAFF